MLLQRLLRKNILLVSLLTACCCIQAVWAGAQDRPDEALRQMIKTALSKSPHFVDRFDAEVWLVDMAGRLERRAAKIPLNERMEILRHVHRIAHEYELNPQLVLAVMEVESNFDKFAISKAGARGLMQIMPFWRDEIGKPDDNLFEIETNIRYGCAILSIYLDRERKRLAPALARYNGSYGHGNYPAKVLNAFHNRWFVREDRREIRTAQNQVIKAPVPGIKPPEKSARQ